MNNDDKIKKLLAEVNSKKDSLGTKPKAVWKTNGLITSDKININTINSTDKCIELAAAILLETSYYAEACKVLGLPEKDSERMSMGADMLDDIKLRTKMIIWDGEKKKLEAMEKKLRDLRSNDAKTEDALSDIEENLR